MNYNSIITNAFTLCAGEGVHTPSLGVVAFGQKIQPLSFYKFLDQILINNAHIEVPSQNTAFQFVHK